MTPNDANVTACGVAGPVPAAVATHLRKNLMLFGADFSLQHKASELNYWRDMVAHVAPHVDEIVVLSVNNRRTEVDRFGDNGYVYNIPPVVLRSGRQMHPDPEFCGRAFHVMPMALLYKSATLLRNLPLIDEIVHRHRIGIIHFMRVFGLFDGSLMRRHPDIVYTITVPTHIDRGYPAHILYHAVRNNVFRRFDRVVTTTEATRARLTRLGFAREKMVVVPWSTDDAAPRPSLRGSGRFVLWAGPLQDSSDEDFLFAVDVARQAGRAGCGLSFRFAFKPNKLRKWHRKCVRGLDNVAVTETSREAFAELQDRAALFLSPICNHRRTVAPPLTWLEMMGRGVPVMTTLVDGVDEVITHGLNGLVVPNPEAAAHSLCELTAAHMAAMGRAAQQTTAERYDMQRIAQAHLALWGELLGSKMRCDKAVS